MNKIDLSDNYSVMIDKPLSDYDRKTLNTLYLPIVGGKVFSLYNNLNDSIISGEYESQVNKLEKLVRYLELGVDDVERAINKLEAIGLIETYYSEGLYVFYLKGVKTPSQFFQDEVLFQALISVLTKEEAEKLALDYLVRRIDLANFEIISKRFDEVFEIEEEINHLPIDNLIIESNDGLIIKNEKFNYRHFCVFASALGILDDSILETKELKNFVHRYSFLYNLNEEDMKDAIACSVNSTKDIDYDLAIKNIKRIYNNKNKKNVKVVEKTKDSNDAKVRYLESTTPQDIVKNKYNESMVASEIATMDELLKTTGIGIGFLNTVLIYVLEEKNGEIPSYNYFNKIIQTWKRAGVKTTEDALHYLENINAPVKKTYNKTRKNVPAWYNEYQEENKKDLDTKIKVNEENIEDLESFFKVKEE